MHKSKYLAIHPNKCGPQDSLGIDYHWCGNGQGGTPNVEFQFDPTTGNLVGVVFIPKDARWASHSERDGMALTPNAKLTGDPLAGRPR